MTKEEKDLLLKDLCVRLPYGVIVRGIFINHNKDKDKILYEERDKRLSYRYLNRYDSLKPYLRPMNSMTDVEKQIYETLLGGFATEHAVQLLDWLNRKMFDYRGLIEKGLAIAVTADNNPYK